MKYWHYLLVILALIITTVTLLAGCEWIKEQYNSPGIPVETNSTENPGDCPECPEKEESNCDYDTIWHIQLPEDCSLGWAEVVNAEENPNCLNFYTKEQ